MYVDILNYFFGSYYLYYHTVICILLLYYVRDEYSRIYIHQQIQKKNAGFFFLVAALYKKTLGVEQSELLKKRRVHQKIVIKPGKQKKLEHYL